MTKLYLIHTIVGEFSNTNSFFCIIFTHGFFYTTIYYNSCMFFFLNFFGCNSLSYIQKCIYFIAARSMKKNIQINVVNDNIVRVCFFFIFRIDHVSRAPETGRLSSQKTEKETDTQMEPAEQYQRNVGVSVRRRFGQTAVLFRTYCR